MADKGAEQERVAELARSLDCMTEEDLALLAAVKPSTPVAWRKRGLGPSYILIGNRFLYPKKAVADYMSTLVRERIASPAGGML